MVRVKQSKSAEYKGKFILPEYFLDSNLVVLPGIIYNVTFSRYKAASLFSRFKKTVQGIPLINSLANENRFDKGTNDKSKNKETNDISVEALKGIEQFVDLERRYMNADVNSHKGDGEFDRLVLAIRPNLQKIKDPARGNLDQLDDVATVCRIIGVVDDSNHIKITFQALIRCRKLKGSKQKAFNEGLYSVHWNQNIEDVTSKFAEVSANVSKLFAEIDSFVRDYKQALNSKSSKETDNKIDETSGLLTLNPLANALYLHFYGSKDFMKAYNSLQKLFDAFKMPSEGSDEVLSRLIDLTTAVLPFPNYERLALLAAFDTTSRVHQINSMVSYLTIILENLRSNNEYVSHWFYHEATDLQKANVIANQLKSIRLILDNLANIRSADESNRKSSSSRTKQLIRRGDRSSGSRSDYLDDDDEDEDEDDIKAITDFIKKRMPNILSLSEETKRLLYKDYKRIKKSPSGNSDSHVIRNYLEVVIDIPWDIYITRFRSNRDIDLKLARTQLDEDHYGLQNVKKRLLQYLVVLKLLSINAEKKSNLRKAIESKTPTSDNANKDKSSSNDELSGSFIIVDEDKTFSAKNSARSKIKDTEKEPIPKLPKNKLTYTKSPIILLAGPPGIGKTSLAKSIAKSLGRKFQRISLGGIKDESEIRGHRRTYVGAMPGVIVQSLRKARSMNPVILLDEIDKVMGGNNSVNKFNGDPSAALLEVLDPEQNNTFMDHYLGFPIDLSQVIFICTANEPYNLSPPLLDRLEMIEIGAYDYEEKLAIGEKYLLPRQISRNGIPSDASVKIDKEVMKKIILDYTREAGVRNFERKLGTICRHKAVEYSLSLEKLQEYTSCVLLEDVAKYLGAPHTNMSAEIYESPIESSKYGVVNGLSYNSDGSGSVLVFESIGFLHDSKNLSSLHMTGRLGDVLMESAKIGLTFVKLMIYKDLLNLIGIGINDNLVDKINSLEIHLHVPQGAVSKDGPSAGITMTLLFLSLLLEKPVPSDIAMTGEITLRGLVLPIGGVKEKLLGAYLSGIKRVIMPRENRKDLIEEYCRIVDNPDALAPLLRDNENLYNFKDASPEKYYFDRYGISLFYAKEFWDVIRIVWGDTLLVKVENAKVIEYHL